MRWLALAVLLLCACGSGTRACPGETVCVLEGPSELCEPACEADGGGCPQGTGCVQRSACCSGGFCLAALRSVCCPPSGCN
ncbi:MAG TPA: hypothetical protein VLW85_06530 [Myxococcales bacterium]|nr:hypothetical protein [Myxococcales bacterium]